MTSAIHMELIFRDNNKLYHKVVMSQSLWQLLFVQRKYSILTSHNLCAEGDKDLECKNALKLCKAMPAYLGLPCFLMAA